MKGVNNGQMRRLEKTVTMMERGLAPEFQRVYSNLPLVINLPDEHMMVAFGSGLEAARSGVRDCVCPPELCPVHRAMWFDGWRVGLTHIGPVEIRLSSLELVE